MSEEKQVLDIQYYEDGSMLVLLSDGTKAHGSLKRIIFVEKKTGHLFKSVSQQDNISLLITRTVQ